MQSPFNLIQGDTVDIRIIAINFYGSSIISSVGGGAKILTNPHIPRNLINNVTITSAGIIGLSWTQGISTGGTPIIDYTLQYAVEFSTTFITVATGITVPSYTITGLIPGANY